MSFQAMAWAVKERVPKKNGRLRAWPALTIMAQYASPDCDYCGKSLSWWGGPDGHGKPIGTVDHITPRVKGGKDEWTNFAFACWSCNAQKRERTADEYREWLAARSVK